MKSTRLVGYISGMVGLRESELTTIGRRYARERRMRSRVIPRRLRFKGRECVEKCSEWRISENGNIINKKGGGKKGGKLSGLIKKAYRLNDAKDMENPNQPFCTKAVLYPRLEDELHDYSGKKVSACAPRSYRQNRSR